MAENWESAVVELLFDNPLPRNTISKLLGIPKAKLDEILEKLERNETVYQIGYRWFVSTRLIIRREFLKVLDQDAPPDNEFGKFIEEYAAARKLGANKAQAWYLAKQNSAGLV